jgi:hypothetical protein
VGVGTNAMLDLASPGVVAPLYSTGLAVPSMTCVQ